MEEAFEENPEVERVQQASDESLLVAEGKAVDAPKHLDHRAVFIGDVILELAHLALLGVGLVEPLHQAAFVHVLHAALAPADLCQQLLFSTSFLVLSVKFASVADSAKFWRRRC